MARRRGSLAPILLLAVACQTAAPAVSPPPGSPMASPTRRPLGATHESALFAYRVELPPGYRHSDCLSRWSVRGFPFATEIFLPRSETEEVDVGPKNAFDWSVVLSVWNNPEGQDALRWARTHGRQRDGQVIEAVKLGGRDGAWKHIGPLTLEYLVGDRGRMFEFEKSQFGDPPDRKTAAAVDGAIDRMAPTIDFLPTLYALPSPTPAPFRHPQAEAGVDALAAALERSDFAAIPQVLNRKCWWQVAFKGQTEAEALAPAKVVDWLRARAAGGKLDVTVERRPLQPRFGGLPPGGFYVLSTWTGFADKATLRAVLTVGEEADGTWRWTGALFGDTVP